MRVIVGDPAPIAGAEVFLDGVSVGLTGADGSLTIAEVAAGSHTIRAHKVGYEDASTVISVPETTSVTLTLIRIAKIWTEVRISSDKTSYTVGGRAYLTQGLYDDVGNLISGRVVDYTVTLDGAWYVGWGQYSDDPSRTLILNKAGTYVITGVFAGDDTYEPSSKAITITATTVAYTITVRVEGSGPIVGALVLFDHIVEGYTDSAGSITITGVTAGTHLVEARKDGYYNAAATIDVPETTSVTLTMTPIPPPPPPTGRIYVHVTGSFHGIIIDLPDRPVYLDGALAGYTDPRGDLYITNVAEGTHSVRVIAPTGWNPPEDTKSVNVPDGSVSFYFWFWG